jgi:hypothetical protein
MFGDYAWLHQRTAEQEERFDEFLDRQRDQSTLVVEIGAGSAIPTIRHLSERLGQRPHTRVLRINPREAQIRGNHFSFADGAVATLTRLEQALSVTK